ncbi:glycoside hydrolase family 38 N-terminal domain-containing protein [Saccharococcus caldoxylosilyticus]|uniref:glycoside hydrolase family 38 N-terminal domain-containing protein n=1 Tax=Saccharococcus caldoxylosilyticus TaxID=81408 RepID=UPI0002FA8972|nr:glycoside hydrolase family 38 C-terminal domain-containing protein [Parageobacillus caldoxylosilyticus]
MRFHVISHTHWDREWHKTYQQYRVKLVRFMDELIELLETNPAYTSFMLDGQTIILEDYLEIKPANRNRIARLVQEGRLIIGPWYVQPDEFIPSGESLIRNLLIGQQIANEFGPAMQIGYLPDSFGQAAQIPQILNGFGIKNAVFWRGITNEETEKTEFWWEGPDGSKVLTTHLPLGYGNGRMLSTNLEQSVSVIDENYEKLKDMVTSPNILIMCGFDQRNAMKELPEIVEKLNRYYASIDSKFQVKISKLKDYFDAVSQEAKNLKTISGEFRKGKNMRVHISIASTRLDLKKENFNVQNLYEKYVEPVNTISYLMGNQYDNAIINKGWKYILQNHAHDSICNVCTDDTHKEMEMRYKFAKQIGQTILSDTINELIDKIKFEDSKGIPLVVFNTLGHKRKNVVEATLHLKTKQFTIRDSSGNLIPYQIVDVTDENLNDKQIEIGVKNEDRFVLAVKIKFLAEVDGFGYKTFYIKENESVPENSCYVYSDGVFTNDFFQVNIESNGSLTITDSITGKTFNNLNIFEESGNAGDEYDFSPPREDEIITTKDSSPEIKVIHNGPIFATVKITYTMKFPEDTDENRRSTHYKTSTIESYVTVNRYEDRVDIKTVIDNTVKNHRIRALFETGLKTSTHIADQHFGTIRRENYLKQVEYWEKENWEERYYPIYPQQKFVDVSDSERGISILNKGLPQYEILNGNKPVIALTLLSGTDYMGKQDLLYRPGRRSGLHVETPDSIMYGKYEMEYSIVPHSGNDIDSKISQKSNEYTSPMYAVPVYDKPRDGLFYDEYTFIKLLDHRIAISAVKKCENDNGIIVRIYNTTNKNINFAKIYFNSEIFKKVEIADLNEMLLAQKDDRIHINHNEIEIKNIASNEIFNLKFSSYM